MTKLTRGYSFIKRYMTKKSSPLFDVVKKTTTTRVKIYGLTTFSSLIS